MRILIYNWRDLAHPKAGGAEVYTDQIARHWVEAGHDATLFCSGIDVKPGHETTGTGYQVVRRGPVMCVERPASIGSAINGGDSTSVLSHRFA